MKQKEVDLTGRVDANGNIRLISCPFCYLKDFVFEEDLQKHQRRKHNDHTMDKTDETILLEQSQTQNNKKVNSGLSQELFSSSDEESESDTWFSNESNDNDTDGSSFSESDEEVISNENLVKKNTHEGDLVTENKNETERMYHKDNDELHQSTISNQISCLGMGTNTIQLEVEANPVQIGAPTILQCRESSSKLETEVRRAKENQGNSVTIERQRIELEQTSIRSTVIAKPKSISLDVEPLQRKIDIISTELVGIVQPLANSIDIETISIAETIQLPKQTSTGGVTQSKSISGQSQNKTIRSNSPQSVQNFLPLEGITSNLIHHITLTSDTQDEAKAATTQSISSLKTTTDSTLSIPNKTDLKQLRSEYNDNNEDELQLSDTEFAVLDDEEINQLLQSDNEEIQIVSSSDEEDLNSPEPIVVNLVSSDEELETQVKETKRKKIQKELDTIFSSVSKTQPEVQVLNEVGLNQEARISSMSRSISTVDTFSSRDLEQQCAQNLNVPLLVGHEIEIDSQGNATHTHYNEAVLIQNVADSKESSSSTNKSKRIESETPYSPVDSPLEVVNLMDESEESSEDSVPFGGVNEPERMEIEQFPQSIIHPFMTSLEENQIDFDSPSKKSYSVLHFSPISDSESPSSVTSVVSSSFSALMSKPNPVTNNDSSEMDMEVEIIGEIAPRKRKAAAAAGLVKMEVVDSEAERNSILSDVPTPRTSKEVVVPLPQSVSMTDKGETRGTLIRKKPKLHLSSEIGQVNIQSNSKVVQTEQNVNKAFNYLFPPLPSLPELNINLRRGRSSSFNKLTDNLPEDKSNSVLDTLDKRCEISSPIIPVSISQPFDFDTPIVSIYPIGQEISSRKITEVRKDPTENISKLLAAASNPLPVPKITRISKHNRGNRRKGSASLILLKKCNFCSEPLHTPYEQKNQSSKLFPAVCSNCDERITSLQLFLKVRNIYPREKLYICSICESNFESVGKAMRHLRVHARFGKPYIPRSNQEFYIVYEKLKPIPIKNETEGNQAKEDSATSTTTDSENEKTTPNFKNIEQISKDGANLTAGVATVTSKETPNAKRTKIPEEKRNSRQSGNNCDESQNTTEKLRSVIEGLEARCSGSKDLMRSRHTVTVTQISKTGANPATGEATVTSKETQNSKRAKITEEKQSSSQSGNNGDGSQTGAEKLRSLIESFEARRRSGSKDIMGSQRTATATQISKTGANPATGEAIVTSNERQNTKITKITKEKRNLIQSGNNVDESLISGAERVRRICEFKQAKYNASKDIKGSRHTATATTNRTQVKSRRSTTDNRTQTQEIKAKDSQKTSKVGNLAGGVGGQQRVPVKVTATASVSIEKTPGIQTQEIKTKDSKKTAKVSKLAGGVGGQRVPVKVTATASVSIKKSTDLEVDTSEMEESDVSDDEEIFSCKSKGCGKWFKSFESLKKHSTAHVLNIAGLWKKK